MRVEIDPHLLYVEVLELRAEKARLLIALHDAIVRPMGVVPESAEEFYDYRKIKP